MKGAKDLSDTAVEISERSGTCAGGEGRAGQLATIAGLDSKSRSEG